MEMSVLECCVCAIELTRSTAIEIQGVKIKGLSELEGHLF